MAAAAKKVINMAQHLAKLVAKGLPLQIAQHLFRVGSINLVQHILVAKPLPTSAISAYDTNLRQSWQVVIGLPLTDNAWRRGCLPLREGGAAFGAIGLRAPVAYSCAWSRTWSFVARHLGVTSAEEILHADPALSRELRDATAAFRPLVPNIFAVSWEHGVAPSNEFRQKTRLQYMFKNMRKEVLEQMPSPNSAAQFRSCGGPGAGGVLHSSRRHCVDGRP